MSTAKLNRPVPPAVGGSLRPTVDHFHKEVTEVKDLLEGSLRWENMRAALLTVSFPTGGSPVTITHNLGETPSLWISNPRDPGVTVYATNEDRAEWGAVTITLRASQSGEVTLLVL